MATRSFRLLVVTSLALAAAGCTGSNLLPTGNSSLAVSFEIVGEGDTSIDYDCVNFLLGALFVRPLDGTCAATAANAGDPCLNQTDCVGGPCEGSAASAVLDGLGVALVDSDPGNTPLPGNLLGDVCALSTRCNGTGSICADAGECGAGEVCIPPYGTSSDADPFLPPSTLTFSEGLYEISEIVIGTFLMFSDTPTALECTNPGDITNEFGDTLRFRMPAEGTKNLVFRLDLQELENALESGCAPFPAAITDILECVTCDGAP